MKEVKHYICEVCGTEWNDKTKCQKCEDSHYKPLKIVGTKYVSVSNNHKGYPVSITVSMSDGTTQVYKR